MSAGLLVKNQTGREWQDDDGTGLIFRSVIEWHSGKEPPGDGIFVLAIGNLLPALTPYIGEAEFDSENEAGTGWTATEGCNQGDDFEVFAWARWEQISDAAREALEGRSAARERCACGYVLNHPGLCQGKF